MDQDKTKAYISKITQANRSELVVVIFELMLDSISLARNAFAEEDLELAEKELKRAQGFLQEMRGSLDFQYEISANLASLYRYVNEQFVKSIVRRRDVNLESCERVLKGLMESFQEVAKQDNSEPVMKNTQQVYAGLTYGKGTLNEIAIDVNDRGYTV